MFHVCYVFYVIYGAKRLLSIIPGYRNALWQRYRTVTRVTPFTRYAPFYHFTHRFIIYSEKLIKRPVKHSQCGKVEN